MRKSRVNFREPEEITQSRVSLKSNNDLSKARAPQKDENNGISIKEKIDMHRSTTNLRGDDIVKSNADMRKSLASVRMEQSTYSLRSLGKSTQSLRSESGEVAKWSEVQKSCLSLKTVSEEKMRPKNIFDDGEEKLEGCEKVLECKYCY